MSDEGTIAIAIAGAGSVGVFIGGLLALGGARVEMLARPSMVARLSGGLSLTSFEGLEARLAPDRFGISEDPALLSRAKVILVTVKSGATAEMAQLIADHASPDAVVASLQNGVGNADILRESLPGWDIRAGMVPYNIVQIGEDRFHRGTAGDVMIDAGPRAVGAAMTAPGLTVLERADMPAVLWGKLLINLNNALNALSGLTLFEELSDRGWRRLLAAQMEEGLATLGAAGIEPVRATPLPLHLLPPLLRLPTPLFRVVAGRMLKVDRQARSSMWEDLERGRPTEIDVLQGAVIRLADTHGIKVPVIRRVAELVRQAEADGKGAPGLPPAAVVQA